METLITPEMIKKYRHQGAWLCEPLIERFYAHVTQHPDKIAIIDRGKQVTYAQVNKFVERLVLSFRRLGMDKGDTITCQLPNWSEYIFSYLAALQMGLVFVPLSPHYRHRELEFILNLTQAVAVVVPTVYKGFDYLNLIRGLSPRLPYLKNIITVGEATDEGVSSLSQLLDDVNDSECSMDIWKQYEPPSSDLVYVTFTSGTEATPKGVMRTGDILWAIAFGSCQKRGLAGNDIVLPAVPLTHALGSDSGLVAPLIVAGATVVLTENFNPENVLQTIAENLVTQVVTTPAVLKGMANILDGKAYHIPPGCVVASGGDACPSQLIKKLMHRGFRVTNIYGATEGVCVSTELSDDPELIAGTVGTPYPYGELKIVDERGNAVNKDIVGRIGYRGPTGFAGYYKDIASSLKTLDGEGFFYAGDLGYIGEDGRLRVVGRQKEIVIRGGENISPVEIEDILSLHPQVADVAVIGMPDDRLRERICAYIVVRAGEQLSLGEIVSFLKDKIATFKLPERIEIVNHIPRNPMGKILRSALMEDIRCKLQHESGSHALSKEVNR